MTRCVRLRLDTHGSKGVESIRQSDRSGAVGNGLESGDKLFGRGDGSLLSPKFTGVAVYVNERIINDVREQRIISKLKTLVLGLLLPSSFCFPFCVNVLVSCAV